MRKSRKRPAPPPPYRIRYAETADADIERAYQWLVDFSFETAERWLAGIQEAVRKEATNRAAVPGRRNIAPDAALFPERDIFLIRYHTRGGNP